MTPTRFVAMPFKGDIIPGNLCLLGSSNEIIFLNFDRNGFTM